MWDACDRDATSLGGVCYRQAETIERKKRKTHRVFFVP